MPSYRASGDMEIYLSEFTCSERGVRIFVAESSDAFLPPDNTNTYMIINKYSIAI